MGVRRCTALTMTALLVACAGGGEKEPAKSASHPRADPVGGCRDVFLYGANAERTQMVVIDVDAKSNGIEVDKTGSKQTFDLAKPPHGVKVWLDVYLEPTTGEIHCTDSRTEKQMAERYMATAGTLTVEIVSVERPGKTYFVTAKLENARFELEGRPPISIGSRYFERVKVGWLPG